MRAIDRFNELWMPEPNSGCWLWLGNTYRYGYGCMPVRFKTRIAHSASWIFHRGEIPEGVCVLNRCDTPLCVNPDHLFLGSRADNNQDRDSKGRHISLCGEEHGNSKISHAEARQIRTDSRATKCIAKEYKIHVTTVRRIRRGTTWRHIQ